MDLDVWVEGVTINYEDIGQLRYFSQRYIKLFHRFLFTEIENTLRLFKLNKEVIDYL